MLLDELMSQPLDRIINPDASGLPCCLLSGGRILALRRLKQRVGRELASASQCDAGRESELAGAAGRVAVAYSETLTSARLHDDAQAAGAGVGDLVADGTRFEVLDCDVGERSHGLMMTSSFRSPGDYAGVHMFSRSIPRGYAGVTKSPVWPCPDVS